MKAAPASIEAEDDGRIDQQPIRVAAWLAPVAIIGLVLAFFATMAFSNLILARGDTFLYFYPYWQMASDALRAGDIPLWNANIFMGVPFLANSQVGFFYPLNWPVWLLLEVPYAVSASILIHLMIAGLGAFLMARRVLRMSAAAAILSAMLFALGGYLTAQVEHVNQLQGLAWSPWLFVVVQPVVGRSGVAATRRSWLLAALSLAALFALQLLAGHTQSAFISGVALSLWLLTHLIDGLRNRTYVMQIAGLLLTAVGVALAIAAVQLLPTLELTQYSARQGGLSVAEVLSFSWHPLLMTRSLLPSYQQSLFTEYVAFLPLTALVLAVVGAWRWRDKPQIAGLLVLVGAGLVLALGRFTPVYWLLANLPGFDLFRVPARWLVLYALSVAMLAGVGWDALARSQTSAEHESLKRPLLVGIALIVIIMAWGFVASLLNGIIPIGPEAPYERPSHLTVLGWLIELALLAGLLIFIWRGKQRPSAAAMAGLGVLAVVVLWLASRSLPYNNLTTAEAYFDIRPPVARLQALAACEVPGEPCPVPPSRFLSLSGILFDPGDQAEIDTIYQDQLDEQARYDYTIAIKQKEIIAPNLPMVYDLYSVDGFDGGVLPLAAYSNLMSLILPEGEVTADGRLREYLSAVPDTRWLDLFSARYLITDKVGDEWHQGVFFDRQFPRRLGPGESVDVGFVPSFTSDSVWLLSAMNPPSLRVESAEGAQWELVPELLESPSLYRFPLPEHVEPAALTLFCPGVEPCSVEAVTLVDSADDVFQSVVPGPFRQIFSGDVKVYEYLNATPRAWFVSDWQWQPDVATSVAAMQAPDFDPRTTAVVVGDPNLESVASGEGTEPASEGEIVVAHHSAERVVIDVVTDQPGLILLADANYPGWQATLDGQPAPIYQTDGLFKGVFVPAGTHELVYSFSSRPWQSGLIISLLALIVFLIASVALWRSARKDRP